MDLVGMPVSVVAQSSETINLLLLPESSHVNLNLPEAWKAVRLVLLVRSAIASVSVEEGAATISVMVAYLALSLKNLLT